MADASLFLGAVSLIVEKSIRAYGLRPAEKRKPFRWLFESR